MNIESLHIRFTKRGRRSQLRCVRADGTAESADVGANVPYHDLAHFVVERRWALDQGFYGNIARGCTLAQLSDTDFIRGLGPQSLQAEVLARGLQAVASGACTAALLAQLVNAELAHWQMPPVEAPAAMVQAVLAEFTDLTARYNALRDGESLSLEFGPTHEHTHATTAAGHFH